ncbi:hypothetical protein C0992_013364 [Termitomyces sp. T32_za158]|nr:hypothetical protein C0992_013364 [Termitomyces sp. T32_za158]
MVQISPSSKASYWSTRPDLAILAVTTLRYWETSVTGSIDRKLIRRRKSLVFTITYPEASYRNNGKVAGIVYCHDITQKKWGGSAQKTFQVFEKLCGPDAAKKVVLLTTMWDNSTAHARGSLEYREECLKNTYWKDMISKGSIVHRGQLTNEAAHSIISFLLAQNALSVPLQIQQELFDMKKMLKDTDAGITLSAMLKESLHMYKKRIKSSRKEGGSRQAILDLEAETMKIKKQLADLKTPI